MSLKNDFQKRKDFFSNRSSAIFPVLISSIEDTWISVLNYWKLKNNIDDITLTFRIYDEEGCLTHNSIHKITNAHHQFELKELTKFESFRGMVEVEFISTNNIRYSFPGIVAYYRSNSNFSTVHSAGRVKNSDEGYFPKVSRETNWTCKFENNITPFFHIFNGPNANDIPEITVNIHKHGGNKLIHSVKLNGFSKPFQNKIFYADELFECAPFIGNNEYFMSVDILAASIFPRLVVGNFHREQLFHETTHSYPWMLQDDYVDCSQFKENDKLMSILPMIRNKELSLEVVSFPTNCPAEISATIDGTEHVIEWSTGGEGSKIFNATMKDDTTFQTLTFSKGKIPSRLNTNFKYKVLGANTRYSTDIATGAKSIVYPPKHRHWGYGLMGGGYKTIVLLRNFTHQNTCEVANGKVDIYLDNKIYTLDIKVLSYDHLEVCLTDAIKEKISGIHSFAWYMSFDQPSVESYWLSYANDGRICGDHGF